MLRCIINVKYECCGAQLLGRVSFFQRVVPYRNDVFVLRLDSRLRGNDEESAGMTKE